jgi:hypothetical protein
MILAIAMASTAVTSVEEGPSAKAAAIFAASGVVLYVLKEIILPWRRKSKLKHPCDVRFVVRGMQHATLNYVVQDDETHRLKELVLPANSIVDVEIGYIPQLPFFLIQMVFGCEGDEHAKPFVLECFDRFTEAGKDRWAPGRDDGHTRDIHKYYHIVRNQARSVGTHYVLGFKIQTRGVGVYPTKVSFITDEIEGEAELMIRVEEKPTTRMRCSAKGHFGCFVRPNIFLEQHVG